ncbi:MAG: myo-inositol 2-dehydrogenase, partial [Actinobacteria bacterium HGW-Actinobacteria-5]
MKQIGVGVIALGWMGRLHSRGFRQVAERYPELGVDARLVAAADPVPANREAARGLGFERAVEDYREVLADPQIEAVSICAPNFLHHEIAMAAVGAGKHFWIEKPMGVNAAQSREIAQAAAAAGLVTAAGFNYRHQPAVEHARDLVCGGRLGRVTNARVWLIADYASSPEGPHTWRYVRAQAGAGVVGDLLSHGIDLAQYLLGSRITEVTAMTDTFITTRPVPLGVGVGHSAV